MIKDAICEIGMNSAVRDLGIDQLIQGTGNSVLSDTMSEMDPEELRKENQKLKNARLCQVCKDKDASELFLPCVHLKLFTLFTGVN